MNPYVKAKNTPLIEINAPLFDEFKVKVFIKCDFLNHPQVQGNKFHKLKLNAEQAIIQNKTQLLTFGGAFSNHIAATASLAKSLGMSSYGVIRGEELEHQPNKWSHTLKTAKENGMAFIFISRKQYKERANRQYLQDLQVQFPDAFIIPEGGSNALAIKGFAMLCCELNQQCPNWTHLFTSVGTGGTLAGLSSYAYQCLEGAAMDIDKEVIGVCALKQGSYLIPQIEQWQNAAHDHKAIKMARWKLLTQYHCGGYAKTNRELLTFKADFEQAFQIPLDPVYTSKTFLAFYKELTSGNIVKGSQVILYHSGGLQGNPD